VIIELVSLTLKFQLNNSPSFEVFLKGPEDNAFSLKVLKSAYNQK
jgi:hypothetical protein